MNIQRFKSIAAAFAGCAITASVALVVNGGAASDQRSEAGGSGDSATGTTYTQPSVKPMTIASTTTVSAAATNVLAPMTLATSKATPTYKATPAPICVNNGQCP